MCLICYVPPVNGFERVAAPEASLRVEAPAPGCMRRRSTLAHWGRRGWGYMVRVCLGGTGCPSHLVQYQAVGRNSPPLQYVCRAAGAGEAVWSQNYSCGFQTNPAREGRGRESQGAHRSGKGNWHSWRTARATLLFLSAQLYSRFAPRPCLSRGRGWIQRARRGKGYTAATHRFPQLGRYATNGSQELTREDELRETHLRDQTAANAQGEAWKRPFCIACAAYGAAAGYCKVVDTQEALPPGGL